MPLHEIRLYYIHSFPLTVPLLLFGFEPFLQSSDFRHYYCLFHGVHFVHIMQFIEYKTISLHPDGLLFTHREFMYNFRENNQVQSSSLAFLTPVVFFWYSLQKNIISFYFQKKKSKKQQHRKLQISRKRCIETKSEYILPNVSKAHSVCDRLKEGFWSLQSFGGAQIEAFEYLENDAWERKKNFAKLLRRNTHCLSTVFFEDLSFFWLFLILTYLAS